MADNTVLRVVAVNQRVQTPAGELHLLHDISFAVQPGETVAIIGASGSGKSTLLGLLAGLDQATDGQIFLAGRELTALDEDGKAALRAQCVGFVFQNFQLLPSLTATENVALPLELAGHAASATARAVQLLDEVGLSSRYDHFPRTLSGGEQQRVAIARAFAANPQILFADEPTGNLDSDTAAQIIELLFAVNRAHGTTLVLVTHDEQLAARCDRRLRMQAGRLTEEN